MPSKDTYINNNRKPPTFPGGGLVKKCNTGMVIASHPSGAEVRGNCHTGVDNDNRHAFECIDQKCLQKGIAMKHLNLLLIVGIVIGPCSGVGSNAVASPGIDFSNIQITQDTRLKISGTAAVLGGQFVKAHYDSCTERGTTTNVYAPFPYPVWVYSAYARIRLDAWVRERLHIIVSPEVRLWTNTMPASELIPNRPTNPLRQYSTVTIADAEGICSFGDLQKPFLSIAVGVFPYKYNQSANNLGEYLFRSGCYPPFMITDFDRPYATLTGLRLSSMLFDHLYQDLLLTTETQVQPLYDWSLSYLASIKVPSLLEMGGGISFYRLLPISDSLTSPQVPLSSYVTNKGERRYYTFSGTKLMAHLSFDLKGLLPASVSGIFGQEDLKISSEIALLGITDQPPAYTYEYDAQGDSSLVPDSTKNYYRKISDRIPVMVGINLPTFKLLDILSVQLEWYRWPYANGFYASTSDNSWVVPLPERVDNLDLTKSSLKWSVYLKKTVYRGFSVIAQCANDHTHQDVYENFGTMYHDNLGTFLTSSDWGWWLKLQYNF